jgi:hypothetical protein
VYCVECINMRNCLLLQKDVANKWFLTRGSFQNRASFALLPSGLGAVLAGEVIVMKLPCLGKL